MDPEALKLFAEVFLEVTTFVILLFGLFGLLIPVFPGLTVMWIATLVYAIVRLSVGNMTWVGWLLFVVI
ncbi:MAG TPA: hypothetical protein PKN81_16360, partial [Anaerolineales bacterium]|nr:hypothetical protein [Anaerolineales bacterium]